MFIFLCPIFRFHFQFILFYFLYISSDKVLIHVYLFCIFSYANCVFYDVAFWPVDTCVTMLCFFSIRDIVSSLLGYMDKCAEVFGLNTPDLIDI